MFGPFCADMTNTVSPACFYSSVRCGSKRQSSKFYTLCSNQAQPNFHFHYIRNTWIQIEFTQVHFLITDNRTLF